MKQHRINILGASGTGKTTLAKALAKRLAIQHFDSDDYFHIHTDPPFRKQHSPDERVALLEQDLKLHLSWVLSGGAGLWSPAPKLDLTLIIFLYLPADLRMERLRRRESANYGSRIEPGGDMHDDHRSFMNWTLGYDDGSAEGTNTLPLHQKFLQNALCPVILIEKPMTTEQQLNLISSHKDFK